MPTAGVSAIFKPFAPGQAVATLFLIENSKTMASAWPHLRDHHLPTLLGAMRIANPIVPIQILLLTSSPAAEEPGSAAPAPARQYYDLPDVRFNYHPDNRISAHNIERGIQLLATTFQGLPTVRHIVIIAATRPSDDFGISQTTQNGCTGRQILAQKLAQENIHCHMILNPSQETEAFANLFYETLHLQNNEEVPPCFPMDSQTYRFYGSARPSNVNPHNGPRNDDTVVPPAHVNAAGGYDRSSMQRNYTFPLDAQAMAGIEEVAEPSDVQPQPAAPSLVSRLQKVHGLTKKKIYGTQAAPQPFFRPERVRDKYRQVPTPLTIPSPPQSMPQGTGFTASQEGRAMSRPRSDRNKRLSDKVIPTTVSSDSRNARLLSPRSRRSSRVSSPDNDSPLSSPTLHSSYNALSPVVSAPSEIGNYHSNASSPVTPSGDYLYTQQPTESQTMESPGTVPFASSVQPTWLENQYPVFTSTFSVEGPAAGSVQAQSHSFTAGDAGGVVSNGSMTDSTQPASHYQPVDQSQLASSSSGASSRPAKVRPDSSLINRKEPQVDPTPSDDGDRPFIFCPEYEAAAAARLQAVLNSSASTLHMPSFTSNNTSAAAAIPVGHASNRGRRGHTQLHPSSISPSRVDPAYGQHQSQPPSFGLHHNAMQAPLAAPTITSASYAGSNSSSLHGWGG